VNFRVLPEADGDAIAAALWYEERQFGLADEFFTQMRCTYELIRHNPLGAPLLEYNLGSNEIRRRLLKHFPYAVIYACRPDEVVIVAVTHTRRRPLHWMDRLG
jgi:plasmid stabilization system protein ParE